MRCAIALALALVLASPANAVSVGVGLGVAAGGSGAGGSGIPTISNLAGSALSNDAIGTALVTPASTLSGCSWTIASQSNFAQASGGAVTKAASSVTAGSYAPVTTCSLTVNGQTVTVSAPLSLTINAAPVTLAALSISPATAIAGSVYSGTISGRSVGSTLSAGACTDGTTPSLSGTTLTATFAAAGSPTCPITETLAGATNTPRVTNLALTVSAGNALLLESGAQLLDEAGNPILLES